MFQMPLHFNRTGVRVVAMCPGLTATPIVRKGIVVYVKEYQTFLEGLTYQP